MTSKEQPETVSITCPGCHGYGCIGFIFNLCPMCGATGSVTVRADSEAAKETKK